jgi:hydrogenase maturation protein HypF
LKNQKVIGAAFDGTGLGSDGKLWGAEFLVCDYRNFQRAAHLKEVPLVGGEKAILEPWRLVEAWFDFKYSPRGRQLQEVYAAGINSPLASSMGRLFDAAAVLILGKEKAEFEGQLAVELEERAKGVMLKKNGSSVNKPENVISVSCSLSGSGVIDPFAVLLRIIKMLREGSSREEAAYYFHQAIAQMTAEVAVDLKKKSGINKVCLSGGVFQNKILLKLTGELLYNKGLSVYTHKKLSCNDSCISLGQAVIAGMRG